MPIKRVDYAHYHKYLINGIPAMGVTTALGKAVAKPQLIHWAARTVAEHVAGLTVGEFDLIKATPRDEAVRALQKIPFDIRNRAAARGTAVHKLAEPLIAGGDAEVPDELSGYADSLVMFMDEWQVRPVLVEAPVGSYMWHYAGTFDLIADLPDGRRVLFDYKTSDSGIYPETALQLAAYRYADVYVGDDGTEMPMTDVGIDECKAVWVRPDGYDVIPLVCDEKVFKAFLHVLSVARFTDSMKDLVGAAEFPA